MALTPDKGPGNFLRYSGLAIQMAGVLLIFTWLGRKADVYFDFKTPWITLLAILLGLFGILYKLIRDFTK